MGIFQARILEWVAIPSSRGSSRPRNWTRVSCIAGGFFTSWTTREALTITRCLQTPGKMRPNHTFSQTKKGVLILFSEDVPRGCLAGSVLLGCGQRGSLWSGSLQGCRVVPVVVKQREPAQAQLEGEWWRQSQWWQLKQTHCLPCTTPPSGPCKETIILPYISQLKKQFQRACMTGSVSHSHAYTWGLNLRLWCSKSCAFSITWPIFWRHIWGPFSFYLLSIYSLIVFPLEFIFILFLDSC